MSDNTLDYGVIGNCRTAALITKRGAMEWLCLPDFDSPSLFAALLDRDRGGRFALEPEGEYVSSQDYLPGTNILRTRFATADASFEVLDFMPRYKTSGSGHYMPPEIHRILRPVSGSPKLRIVYQPAMNYAREKTWHSKLNGYIRTASEESRNETVYLYTSIDFDTVLESREFFLKKEEFLVLSYHQKLVPVDLDRVFLEFERTRVYWLNWAARSVKFERYGDLVIRSLLVLKLMTFEKSGAILAAVTTSIPEVPGGVRNWDYRYCWLRDASMSIGTLLRMGHHNSAANFLGFIKRIVKSKDDAFQIMYGIRGERVLTEQTLDHLAGFENSRPVRVGNAAYDQRQNDSLGYLLDVIHTYYHFFPGTLDDIEEMWEIVKKVVRIVAADWREPDNSIWEFRNRRDHFVFSKVMSWVALDRAARIASFLGLRDYEEYIRLQAEAVHEDVCTHGWNERLQSFTQAYGTEDMDASLLLMEQYGFIKADDPRYVSTVTRIREELLHKGLMFRYKNSDDFGVPGTAFTICTFWMVRALHVTGREQEALELFENLVAHRNHVGLFSEDLEFASGRQLGNFPQAYSHLALIDVVSLISERTFWSRFIQP